MPTLTAAQKSENARIVSNINSGQSYSQASAPSSSSSRGGGSYTFTGTDGKQYLATPNANITSAQSSAVANNPAYTPVKTTVDANSLGVSTPINVPPPATPKNFTSTIASNNTGLGAVNPDGTLATNVNTPTTATAATEPKEKTLADRFKAVLGLYKEPVDTADIYEQARSEAGINQKKSLVNSLTNELNTITAKSTADQLSVTGQGRGIPEAIIGGQQAQISKEAAIRALPVQAQLAAAQGDLAQAESHLDTLFKIRVADATAQNDRYNKLVDIAYSEFSRAEQNKIEDIRATRDINKASMMDAVDFSKSLSLEALKNGNTSAYKSLVALTPPDVSSKTFAADLAAYNKEVAKYGSTIAPKASASAGSNQQTDNERALMSQFRGEQIVKDYNEVLSQKGTIDSAINNGVGGPADLFLVFSFMKGLDPNSVVRETEYATAAKSGNIFQGAFAKFNGYFKEKGGFLPDNVKKEFQNLVNLKLAVKEKQYNNVKSQYEGIADRQGLNKNNVVIDYAGGAIQPASTPSAPVTIAPSTTKIQGLSASGPWGSLTFPSQKALDQFKKDHNL